jgi:hypothetical protein
LNGELGARGDGIWNGSDEGEVVGGICLKWGSEGAGKVGGEGGEECIDIAWDNRGGNGGKFCGIGGWTCCVGVPVGSAEGVDGEGEDESEIIGVGDGSFEGEDEGEGGWGVEVVGGDVDVSRADLAGEGEREEWKEDDV